MGQTLVLGDPWAALEAWPTAAAGLLILQSSLLAPSLLPPRASLLALPRGLLVGVTPYPKPLEAAYRSTFFDIQVPICCL